MIHALRVESVPLELGKKRANRPVKLRGRAGRGLRGRSGAALGSDSFG